MSTIPTGRINWLSSSAMWTRHPMQLLRSYKVTLLLRLSSQRINICQRTSLVITVLAVVVTANMLDKAYAQSNDSYYDDTHRILDGGIASKELSGNFGYDRFQFQEPADGRPFALDVRNSEFQVANSANPNPTSDFDCNQGSDPVNRYPLNVYDADKTAIVGGLINGHVPQESDWEPTYCNSAAVHFKYASTGTVDGIRITSAWDAFRMSIDSPGLAIRNSWISNVRDDVVENDFFFSTVFEDNLVDGTFQGISVHSGGDILVTPTETVLVSGSVIKIREYLYKGSQRFGALFKNETSSPASEIYDTVVAVDYQGGRTWRGYWEKSWSKIESCANNLFLWLSDSPIPDSVPPPPSCFTVMTGEHARRAWAEAKRNWIDCHPRVARAADDPESNPAECIPNTFGGYSRGPSTRPVPVVLRSE